MVPCPAMATSEPSTTLIFLYSEHGLYVVKRVKKWLMWSMAPKSMIQGLKKQSFETLREREMGQLLDCAKEQEALGLSGKKRRVQSLSISSLLKPPLLKQLKQLKQHHHHNKPYQLALLAQHFGFQCLYQRVEVCHKVSSKFLWCVVASYSNYTISYLCCWMVKAPHFFQNLHCCCCHYF